MILSHKITISGVTNKNNAQKVINICISMLIYLLDFQINYIFADNYH